jgi:hypothetical protein
LVAFTTSPLLRFAFPRIRLAEPNFPPLRPLFGHAKDSLELGVDYLSSLGGVPLRSGAELDGGIRCRILLDSIEAMNQ